MGIRPEDVLPDNKDTIEIDGQTLRKGTIAAALKNVEVLESKDTSRAEKQSALKTIKELAPSLVLLGLHKHLTWKNPEIQKIIEDCLKNRK
jgi:hypothetical protein